MKNIKELQFEAITILKQLIAIPSFSSEEEQTALILKLWLERHGIATKQSQHNIYAFNENYDPEKPTLLLNSHHDTVKPNKGYTKDPFIPVELEGKLYGLGSNDAGGCLVALIATFIHFYKEENLSHNIVLVASAEEESSGNNGLNSVLPLLPTIAVAIVGEPTLMQLAIAEKGLVVFDAIVKGTPSHAAHPNTNNSIYKSIETIQWCHEYQFDKISRTLGETKLTLTQINAGKQHNVVPAEVKMVIDVRVNDCYTNQEIAMIIENEIPCDSIKPRSLRLNSSSISKEHPLVQAGIGLGRKVYGSPTLSDQAVLSCPSLKMGPGNSKRSHSADEFIYVKEIEEGIELYIKMITKFLH